MGYDLGQLILGEDTAPKEPVAQAPLSTSGVRAAADINNPSGLGWNGKTWKAYATPEEGVADTQALVSNYLANPARNTPQAFVGTWVNGDPKTGASVQGGAYVAGLHRELEAAGVKLNENGTIPNTPEANAAVTRAIIQHESPPQHVGKFMPHVSSGAKEQTDAYAPADKAIPTAQAAEPSLGDLILGGTELHEPKAAAPQAAAPLAEQPTAAPTAPVSESGIEQLPVKNLTPAQQAKGEESVAKIAGNVDAVLAMPAGLVKSLATAYMYLGERAMPGAFPLEKREEIANSIGSALTPEFAKHLGIDPNNSGYQEALLQKVGHLFEKGIDYAAEKTGLPKSDLEAFANLLPFTLPKVKIKGAVESIKEQFAAKQAGAPKLEPKLGETVENVSYMESPEYTALKDKLDENRIKFDELKADADKFPENTPERMAANEKISEFFDTNIDPLYNQLEALAPKIEKPKLTADQYGQLVEAEKSGATPETLQTMVEQFNAKKATGEPIEQITAPTAAAPIEGRELKGVGAAKAEHNPYTPFVNEEHARGGDFPMVKLSNGSRDVPAPEQQTRAQIAREILGTDQVRTGVVTGNENTLRNEVTLAKKPEQTLEGQLLKDQIAVEQQALSNYAQNIIRDTGADEVLANNYERGERINHAAVGEEGIGGFIQNEKRRIYEQARQQVGDNPVEASNLKRIINSPQFEAELKLKGIKDFTSGINDLIQMHETAGFEGTAPGSIAGLEALRQSLNRGWTPQNSHFVGRVIRAIDNDIASAGGPGLYEQARNLHAAEKTLFGSKGIKTLFGEIDPNGVQTATSFDQITKKLNSMPFDEWRHVFDTFDRISRGTVTEKGVTLNIPKELQQAAESAKREILGSLAREVYEQGAQNAGVWNYNAANKTMNARSKKMEYAFDPETLKKMHTLNYGGHIMPGMHGYEGAALQAERVKGLGTRLLELPVRAAKGMAASVPFFGGAVPAVSETLAENARTRALNRAALETRRKMRENAKLGTKLSDIGKE
jgi:hypothetical protein